MADLAVVVVNFCNGDDLPRALESARAAAGEVPLELVVVDNASPDDSVARIQEAVPDARIVHNDSNRGFAAGVNRGFRESTAPFVLLLNPDTIVAEGALTALVERLNADSEIGVAVPLLFHEDGSPQPNLYKRQPTLLTLFSEFCIPVSYALQALGRHPHQMRLEEALAGKPIEHAYGAALCVRRDAYDQTGPFDEGFFLYLEETEWQGRLRAAGWTIAVVPEAKVTHFVRGGGEASEVASPHYLRSAYRYFGLRGVAAGKLDAVLLTATVLSRIAFTLIALIPGKREQSLRRRAGYRELTRWVRRRRQAA